MAVVVNNPQPTETRDSGSGFLVGIILLILAVVLFFYYGLPMIRSYTSPQASIPSNINVHVSK
ncbi:MAG TPA: hypothetical protein VLF93_01885 [Candidatus Saccharimonadales bacterium]|nr:hypothetical protein [Candidatus Saccharimonadales bacterium]